MELIRTYVSSDGLLHSVDATGADSVLPFSSDEKHSVGVYITSNNGYTQNIMQVWVDEVEVVHQSFAPSTTTQTVYTANI